MNTSSIFTTTAKTLRSAFRLLLNLAPVSENKFPQRIRVKTLKELVGQSIYTYNQQPCMSLVAIKK